MGTAAWPLRPRGQPEPAVGSSGNAWAVVCLQLPGCCRLPSRPAPTRFLCFQLAAQPRGTKINSTALRALAPNTEQAAWGQLALPQIASAGLENSSGRGATDRETPRVTGRVGRSLVPFAEGSSDINESSVPSRGKDGSGLLPPPRRGWSAEEGHELSGSYSRAGGRIQQPCPCCATSSSSGHGMHPKGSLWAAVSGPAQGFTQCDGFMLFFHSWGPDDDGKTVDGPHQLGKVEWNGVSPSPPPPRQGQAGVGHIRLLGTCSRVVTPPPPSSTGRVAAWSHCWSPRLWEHFCCGQRQWGTAQ